ncbi:acyl-CoA dehydrogenase family protein [Brevibacillus laterosporus]|uniref:Acyl-CoA dehydrogenase n=2 Tax=Brevibacillus TaxID=55080 RepID=A0A0F7EJX6_BRELA|nr:MULTISPECIES: acyl-CoA dehydrogenase family protein [Brevibacillus]AKF96329.1 acyl-CoA dehydrogenase [Brevibacillus laterosporus]MCR8987237.1 acyl-CoA dehydrogenase family protein [Brevibacillus laterosporus]MCZ0832974.1 acyl-CoA dehydrogenase family protein [Brevibacillus halotolerans]
MNNLLTAKQKAHYDQFLAFAEEHVEPYANQWDREERIPRDIIETSAKAGFLGGTLPAKYKGQEWDFVTYGLLNEAIGRFSISLSGLFNVHTMVAQTLLKWGTEEQKKRWLTDLSTGKKIAALALTEPGAGSDLQMMETSYTEQGDYFLLNGKKQWITFGAVADVLLVFGKLEDKPVAFLVERDSPGLMITPIQGMLGFKASHLAILEFDNCVIPKENMIGKPNFALSYLAPYALEFGRISIAFASLGLLRGCLEICGSHVMERKAFNARLIDHGMISHFMADMGVDYEATAHLCISSCKAKDEHSPEATEKIMIAKYFASRAGARHSANAVQIMGAMGCNENFSVSRFYRDSKTMEIVEGSNQIHQMILGSSFAKKAKRTLASVRTEG